MAVFPPVPGGWRSLLFVVFGVTQRIWKHEAPLFLCERPLGGGVFSCCLFSCKAQGFILFFGWQYLFSRLVGGNSILFPLKQKNPARKGRLVLSDINTRRKIPRRLKDVDFCPHRSNYIVFLCISSPSSFFDKRPTGSFVLSKLAHTHTARACVQPHQSFQASQVRGRPLGVLSWEWTSNLVGDLVGNFSFFLNACLFCDRCVHDSLKVFLLIFRATRFPR